MQDTELDSKGLEYGKKENADGKSTLTGNNGGIPDGTHPSDYSKGKKPNDMSASKSDGIIGVNR